MDRFRAERLKNAQDEWWSIGITIAIALALPVWIALSSGWQRTLAAFLFGSYLTLLTFLWIIGVDVHALTWRWGAVGEEWTAEELKRLGPDWWICHDLADGQGNWDHVVVGPQCAFVVDSKNLSGPITIGADGGRSGRLRFGGAASRGSAARLSELLEREAAVKIWVQPVVAVWGRLPDIVERDGVLYVPGPGVVSALEGYPRKLRSADRPRVVAALDTITS